MLFELLYLNLLSTLFYCYTAKQFINRPFLISNAPPKQFSEGGLNITSYVIVHFHEVLGMFRKSISVSQCLIVKSDILSDAKNINSHAKAGRGTKSDFLS